MAQQTINIGASPNDGTGTPLRTAFQYTNSNFSELYTAVGPSGNNIVVPGNATITGDLTVDTNTLKVDSANNRVGIGTASPSKPLEVYNTTESTVWANTTTGIALLRAGGTGGDFYFGIDNSTGGGFGQGNYSRLIYSTGAYPIIFSSNASERYRIASDGIVTWSNVDGVAGTAMTLNATGLGVGMIPANNLSIGSATYASFGVKIDSITQSSLIFKGTPDAAGYEHAKIVSGRESSPFTYGSFLAFYTEGKNSGTTDTSTERLRIDSSGNVGIGVAPGAWFQFTKALQFSYGAFAVNNSIGYTRVLNNAIETASGGYIYQTTNAANNYTQALASGHQWFTAPSGTVGTAITFTQAMTLDASGSLALGQASSALQSGGTGITIYGSTASEIKFLNSTTGSGANDGTALVTSANNFSINNRESGSVSIGTTNTQRIIVKTDGQVRFVPLAADPGGAEAGDVYYNSSSNKLKCYNGSTWNDLF